MNQSSKFLLAIPLLALATSAPAQQLPAIVDALGKTVVLKVHAEGAQIYDAKPMQAASWPGPFASRSLRFSPTARRSAATMPVRTGNRWMAL